VDSNSDTTIPRHRQLTVKTQAGARARLETSLKALLELPR
jgi:hypothetical protein